MSNRKLSVLSACALILIACGIAQAHPGRRFEVRIVDNRLVAQGVNTLESRPMGELPTRPYANVIHDHFTNYVISGEPIAVANLPGFDVPAELRALWGYRVMLRIDGTFEVPLDSISSPVKISDLLKPLEAPRTLTISMNDGAAHSTALPKELTLVDTVPRQGSFDLDPHFQASFAASDSFIVIVLTIMATAPGIQSSAPVWIVLAPPGHQFHHSALRLEERIASELNVVP